jgi:hypothetical protein
MTQVDLDEFDGQFTYRYDVFISYSSAQETEASAIYEELREEMAVFFAPITLPRLDYEPDQYVEVLTKSLTQSCQLLILLSERFLESSWCQLEMYGYLNLCHDEERRRMWIAVLEDGVDKHVGGQFVPMIFSRTEAIDKVRKRHLQAVIRAGEQAQHTPPRMFVALPLYERYEPPTPKNRPPWGTDSRSPHGMPGAPPFDIYERMVREYMVQLSRRRAGEDFDSLFEEEVELELSIPMEEVGEQYGYMKMAARSDAEYMLSMGYLGHSGNSSGRLEGSYMLARGLQAQLHGHANWEDDLHAALGRILMGNLDEIGEFERAIETVRNPTT